MHDPNRNAAHGTVTTRRARIEDAPAVAALSGELGYPTSPEKAAGRMRDVLGSAEHAAYVAVDAQDNVIGWVHVFVTARLESEPFCELGGFVVGAGYRGAGIGKQLLAEAESWAVRTGVTTLRVRSRSTRGYAHEFYKRMGFLPSKTQEVFDKPLQAR